MTKNYYSVSVGDNTTIFKGEGVFFMSLFVLMLLSTHSLDPC